MVLNPVVLRTMRRISRGLTATLTGSWYAPYTTAGICPARRVRRASFLPREARTSAATVISFLTSFLLQAFEVRFARERVNVGSKKPENLS